MKLKTTTSKFMMRTKRGGASATSGASASSVKVKASTLLKGNVSCVATNEKVEIIDTRLKEEVDNQTNTTLTSMDSLSSSNDDDVATVDPVVGQLHKEFPSVTLQECQRFLTAARTEAQETQQADSGKDKKDEASVTDPLSLARQQLQQFVEWRSMYGITSIGVDNNTTNTTIHNLEQDREDWATAWKMMWSKTGDLFPASSSNDKAASAKETTSTKDFPPKDIPQYLFAYVNPTDSSQIMVQVLAARIEVNGASPKQHSLAVNLYLDRKFQRCNANQRATLCLDVRGGPQWCNATVFTLSPIISTITHHAVQYHPQRIQDTVVFPIPSIAVHLFHLFKKALPPVVGNQMRLVAGSERNCPPMSKIAQKTNLNVQVLEQMEVTRELVKEESIAAAAAAGNKTGKWW